MKALLIYNNFAGGKTARKKRYNVLKEIRKHDFQVELYLTKPNKQSVNEIREMDLSPYDAFIIGGGDGTIMEALNGYIQNQTAPKPPIGFIPVGTGNAFVRDIDLQTGQICKAVELITKNNVKPVDVAYAKTDEANFYFFNIMGIGFVSDVAYMAQKFKFLGNLSYTIGIFIKALSLNDQNASLEIDGQRYKFNYNFIEVSNTRYTSNFLIAPSAKFDDGYLDVTVLEKISLFRLLSSFPKILKGTHIAMPEVKTFKAKHIKIESEKQKLATPDGELIGTTPIEIECRKHQIRIFY